MLPQTPLRRGGRRAVATGFAGAVLAMTLFGPLARTTADAATPSHSARPGTATNVTPITGDVVAVTKSGALVRADQPET